MRLRGWHLYLAGGAVAALLYRVGPLALNSHLFEAIGLSAAAAMVAGVVVHRPARWLPWAVFAVAQTVFVAGDVLYYSFNLEFPSYGDGFYLAFYPLMAAGLLLLIRSRTPGHDWNSLLDASIIAIGLGVLAWVFLIEPYTQASDLTAAERMVSIAYPLADVLLMAVAVRLLIGPGRRPKAFWLLLAGIVCLLLTDSVYGWIQINSVYNEGGLLDLGWIATYLLWGAAALHPSMKELFEEAEETEVKLSRGRLGLLAAATLIAPIVLIVRAPKDGSTFNIPVVQASSAVLFLLVLARMTGLMSSLREAVSRHEQAEQRERVLRQAAAGLTAAPDRAAIAESTVEAAMALSHDIVGLEVDVEIYPDPKPATPATFAPLETELGPAVPELLLAVPLATQTAVYGIIVAAAKEPLPHDFTEGLRTLGSQMTLAIESATFAENLNRQRSEARVAALIRNSSDVVMVLDTELNIRYVTPSVSRVLGYSEIELLGRRITRYLHPSDVAKATALKSDLAAHPEGSRTEWRIQHGDGHWMDVESVSNDLRGHPSVNGIVVTTRDITERKALEDGLKSQVRKLQELDRIKNDFVATVSHELRTPLASIIGEVEMLGDGDFGPLNDKQNHVVGVIDRNSHRLLSLIEDLLTLNHIESGALELKVAETNLVGLLEAVKREIEAVAKNRKVRLEFDLDPALGAANVDAEQLDRALINLLTNAVKFSHEGGKVGLVAERADNEIVFTVADNGVGIPADEQDRLFTRFFRSSTATQLAIQGSGLGLVIVKRIAEEHGGTIKLESVEGKGTTVTLTIPATAVPSVAERAVA